MGNGRKSELTFPNDLLDLGPEIGEIKRFFNEAADLLLLKERLHHYSGPRKNNNRGFSNADLFLEIFVTVRAEPSKVGQPTLASRNANIKNHAIGLPFLGFFESFVDTMCGQDLVAQMLKFFFDDLTNIVLIIYDQ
jgi:hypothetical protein